MKINFQWYKVKPPAEKPNEKINMSQFSYKEKQSEYEKELNVKYYTQNIIKNAVNIVTEIEPEEETPQQKWQRITKDCIESSKKVMGTKQVKRRIKDQEIENWSKESQKLRKKIESTKSQKKKGKWRRKRQQYKNKIRNKIAEMEKYEMDEKLKNLENIKNDANKYYQALRYEKNQTKEKFMCT